MWQWPNDWLNQSPAAIIFSAIIEFAAMPASDLQVSSEISTKHSADGGKYADGVNWDDLSFKVTPTDYIYTMKCNDGDEFSQGYLIPHGNIELCPFAGILNYGQGRAALNLYVEDKLRRATTGGAGGVKSITNYAPVYKAQKEARAKGFSDVLFLDSVTGKNIEEISTANIFILKGNVVSTPALINGTVLPGVTRKSIMEIALDFGYQVEERVIPLEDLLQADEAFCTGTAVTVNPIGAVSYLTKRVEFRTGKEALSQKLYETLSGIQTGRLEDKGWTLEVN
ncbi:hypothetical protein ACLB2K_012318 [Fragaria x ananassa]